MAETEVLRWSDADLCHVKRRCQEAEELFYPWLEIDASIEVRNLAPDKTNKT